MLFLCVFCIPAVLDIQCLIEFILLLPLNLSSNKSDTVKLLTNTFVASVYVKALHRG
jgi:hypothetical protein